MPREISEYQQEIWSWAERNFGGIDICPLPNATLGLAEEAGEVCRAVLKDAQGIRGTHEEWMAELKKELGDTFIKVIEVGARAGFDMDEVIANRWYEIKQRDWTKNKVGHGIQGS